MNRRNPLVVLCEPVIAIRSDHRAIPFRLVLMRALFSGVAVVVICAAACGPPPPSPSGSTPPSASSSPAAAPPPAAQAAEGGGEEGHEHAAPHGGTLVELGEEFAHVELVLDSSTGTLTAYALDGEAERAVRLAQPAIEVSFVTPGRSRTQVTLSGVSNPLTGETDADTSQFRAMVPALKGVTEFEGAIKAVAVRGQRFQDVSFRYPSTEHP
jgi:hypothetical protein